MGGCLDVFSLIYHFSFLSPSLWETARYRLKYCLKGPLNPEQSTKKSVILVSRKLFLMLSAKSNLVASLLARRCNNVIFNDSHFGYQTGTTLTKFNASPLTLYVKLCSNRSRPRARYGLPPPPRGSFVDHDFLKA